MPIEPKQDSQGNNKRNRDMDEKDPAQSKFATCFTQIAERQVAAERKKQEDGKGQDLIRLQELIPFMTIR